MSAPKAASVAQLAALPLATATRSRSSHSAPTMSPTAGTRCAACGRGSGKKLGINDSDRHQVPQLPQHADYVAHHRHPLRGLQQKGF